MASCADTPVRVERAAVLGAGVMGAAIAAHLANVGIPTLLLDLASSADEGSDRNAIAHAGLARAQKSKPASFTSARALALIGDTEAIPALFKAWGEGSTMIQYWAEEGLDRMGVGMQFFIPE